MRAVIVLASQLRARIDRQLAGDGLTSQQAAVMSIVRAVGRPSFREVSHTLGTSPQNVRQLVDVLVRKRFARVVSDPSDRRVKRLVATAKNERYWSARDDSDHAELLTLLDDLDTLEVERTVESLLRVLERAHPRHAGVAAEPAERSGKGRVDQDAAPASRSDGEVSRLRAQTTPGAHELRTLTPARGRAPRRRT